MAVTRRTHYAFRFGLHGVAPEYPDGVPIDLTGYPSPANTGARFAPTSTIDGNFTTTSNGQLVERLLVNGNLRVRHNDVTVQDCIVRGTGRYMIEVGQSGAVPTGTVIQYTEVDGSNYTADDASQIYCRGGTELDHIYAHDIGIGVRLVGSGTTVTNSYLHANKTWTGSHREAILSGGPANNITIQHNTLVCTGPGCSSAMSLYGDFGQQSDWLIEDNIFATTGGFCLYAGSEDHEAYPDANNIQVIGNRFSSAFYPQCGSFGYLTAFDAERGCIFQDNVWHESGDPIPDQG